MSTCSGSVYVLCLKAVVQASAALGVDSAALLRDAGISDELLRAPGERIPLARYLDLYRMAVERSGDPDLGLCVGHVIYFSGMNLHLYMTTICRNLKEYFNVIPSAIRIRGDTGRVLIRPQGDFIRLEWHPFNAATGGDGDSAIARLFRPGFIFQRIQVMVWLRTHGISAARCRMNRWQW